MNKELVQLCVDTYQGSLTDYSKIDANEVIRKAFVDMMGTDKPSHRQFRKNSADIFEIMEVVIDDLLDDAWVDNSFFDQFVEYKNLNLGDTNEFYVEDKTMLSVSKLADGHWNLRRQKLNIGDTFSVKVDTYGAKVYADFMRFMAGRMDWGALVNKIQEAMKLKIASEIYVNFMGAMNYLPTEFKKTGSFSEEAMLDIVDQVQVSNGQAPVAIAGTRKALKALTGSYAGENSFMVSENMKNELNQKGAFQMWNGIPLLEIPQVHIPGKFEFMIDDKQLMVLPANVKPIKLIREGQSMIKEVSDGTTNEDMSMEYTFLTKLGIATVFNMFYGSYTLEA